MPFGDRTGPAGSGPGTGRGAGYCGGSGVPGSMNPAAGRGAWGRGGGFGRGGGRGWRNWFYATGLTGWQRAAAPVRGSELDTLKGQAEYFESTLASIRKRIGELEARTRTEQPPQSA